MAVVAGILTAVVPVVGNMDWSSTAGVIAGGVSAVVAIVKWLEGWQAHEAIEAHRQTMTEVYAAPVAAEADPAE